MDNHAIFSTPPKKRMHNRGISSNHPKKRLLDRVKKCVSVKITFSYPTFFHDPIIFTG